MSVMSSRQRSETSHQSHRQVRINDLFQGRCPYIEHVTQPERIARFRFVRFWSNQLLTVNTGTRHLRLPAPVNGTESPPPEFGLIGLKSDPEPSNIFLTCRMSLFAKRIETECGG